VAGTHTRLGGDIALTRYVGTPSALTLDSADSWGGLDLGVVPGALGRRTPTADVSDLARVSERENLGQALILRLLTPRGSLAPLGHPDYGSRLVELIGRSNDEPTRNLARLYVIEAIGQEPRVTALSALALSVAPGRPDAIWIELSVTPIDDADPLAIGLEVVL
jgi:phage baseplate assembly protein W